MATITYTPNKATNYLATQIVGSAIKTIETNLQAKVGSKVVDNLADNLEKVPEVYKIYQMVQVKLLMDHKA